jgi:hypothetical protein
MDMGMFSSCLWPTLPKYNVTVVVRRELAGENADVSGGSYKNKQRADRRRPYPDNHNLKKGLNMRKLAFAAAVSTVATSSAFAVNSYTTNIVSGTRSDPAASFAIQVALPTYAWYVSNTAGAASNISTPAVQLVRESNWTFDFTNPAAAAFSGNIVMNDYRVQIRKTIGTPAQELSNGRESYTGVVMSFSGIGSYNEATNTFTYDFMGSAINWGGASVYSEAASATCANGKTHPIDKACATFVSTSKAWEGLALNFVFAEDRSAFIGDLRGTQTSGSGVTRTTTTINWHIQEVPVPAAAWLFGTGLLGVAAARRRRRKSD